MADAPEPIPWEKVYIFVSSTFSDMHAERDYLVKRVFPELQVWCERRKLRLVDIDLRWGVTEADASSKRAVKVCLDRINDCRPFFLCFLGQRHGWTPGIDGISEDTFDRFPDLRDALHPAASVTELEIRHAILKPFASRDSRNSLDFVEYQPSECAFFYSRDPGYLRDLRDVPRQLLCTYTDEIGPDDEADSESSHRERSREASAALLDSIVGAAGRQLTVYRGTWNASLRTPELAMPPDCGSVEPVGALRWRNQWNRFALLGLTETESRVPQEKRAAADEYNTLLTQGRLAQFESLEESSGGLPAGTELASVIQDDLRRTIQARFPNHAEVEGEDELQKEIDQQEQFRFIHSEGFIERAGDFDGLDTYASNDSNRLFALAATGGLGKTTLLANWVDRYRERIKHDPDHSIHVRFVGVSDRSTTVYSLLKSLLREIKEITGKLDEAIPDDPIQLRQTWLGSLSAIGKRGKTVIVVDALNQLESGLTDVSWIPQTLPDNVKLVVSIKRDDCAGQELCDRWKAAGVLFSDLKPFQRRGHRRRLVKAYLAQYLKQLDKHHRETLINLSGAKNPLYLKVVLSELRVFGAFSNLAAKIRTDFGETPISAFQAVLSRLEEDPAYSPIEPEKAVPLMFGLLAQARQGLSADDLTDLLIQIVDPPDKFEAREAASDTVNLFLRQVRSFLARRNGRYDFFYESFRIAAQECYVAERAGEELPKREGYEWHAHLARYFQLKGDPTGDGAWSGDYPRAFSELPYHLLEGRLFNELFGISREEIFLAAQARMFPGEPQRTLETLQTAIEGACRSDDAARMAEFVLAHARRVIDIARESPLDALRSGQLARAWSLMDVLDGERRVLWHLLLAWELKDTGRLEEARATLERLLYRELPRLSWAAIDLLVRTFDIAELPFSTLQKMLTHDGDRRELCVRLADRGHIAAATETLQSINDNNDRVEAMARIAIAHAREADLESARATLAVALETAGSLENEKSQAHSLKFIALARIRIGEFNSESPELAAMLEAIGDIEHQTEVVQSLSEAQMQRGDLSAAKETARSVPSWSHKAKALGQVAVAQARAGELDHATTTLQEIASEEVRAKAAAEIAVVQIQAGRLNASREILNIAFSSARMIKEDGYRVTAVSEIATAQAAAGDIEAARRTFADAVAAALNLDEHRWTISYLLAEIAAAQVKAKEREPALANFAAARERAAATRGDSRNRVTCLKEVAVKQAEAGEFAGAIETAQKLSESERPMVEIVTAQARAGDLIGATATARSIKPAFDRSLAFRRIASAQEEMHDYTAARTSVAASISSTQDVETLTEEAYALDTIAQAQLEYGDFGGASMTTQRIEVDPYGLLRKLELLLSIAEAQTRTGCRDDARITFAAALDFAEAIDPKSNLPGALKWVAIARAKAGDLTAALDVARRIEGAEELSSALLEVASAQAAADERAAAGKTFAAAVNAAQRIEDPERCARALILVAIAQARAGERDESLTTLAAAATHSNKVDDDYSRLRILKDIAIAQAQAMRFRNALWTVQSMERKYLNTSESSVSEIRSRALRGIVAAYVSASSLDSALEIARSIEYARERIRALCDIAEAQIKRGEPGAAQANFAIALRDAQTLTHHRVFAMERVAEAQARVGELDAALATLAATFEAAQENEEKCEILRRIGATEFEAGKRDAAHETLKSAGLVAREIEGDFQRAAALREIALVWAKAGESEERDDSFLAAIEPVRSSAWPEALKDIAIAQAQAGSGDRVARTAQIILSNRNQHLPEIAKALAAAGDKETFKLLLVPCAYYLDAAYSLCGLLAQIYPEQATAVSLVVSGSDVERAPEDGVVRSSGRPPSNAESVALVEVPRREEPAQSKPIPWLKRLVGRFRRD